jgi:hypothetical protein
MSKNLKCLYCDRYLPNRNAHSQHVKYCKELNISTEESNNDTSDMVLSMSLDSEDFSHRDELQSIREENLLPVSEISYQYESDSSYAGDISFHSNTSNILKEFDEILSESEKSDSNMSEFDEILPKSLSLQSNVEDLSLQSNVEESEVEIKEFPNEAYADLMTLVTENNFSNKAGNAIIKLFNKHSDLSQSPLPKNIETGRKFMDKMNISHLSYSKYRILVHNNKEYFINYRPIKNCIEILLSNPEIARHFMFRYENKEVNIY